jgi:preprotein translocase subunit SecF
VKHIKAIQDVLIVLCCFMTLILLCHAIVFVRKLNTQIDIENRQMIGVAK